MDKGIACLLFLILSIFTSMPSANGQPPPASKRIWCTISPDMISGHANESYSAMLTLYTSYQTTVSWIPAGQEGAGWESYYIKVTGTPSGNSPSSPNSTVDLRVIIPFAIGTRTLKLEIYDQEDPNMVNYTTLTVTTLPQVPGIDFSFVIIPKNVYFDLTKTAGQPHVTGQLYCENTHAFYLSTTQGSRVNGLTVTYPSDLGITSSSSPSISPIDIAFSADANVISNGTYPVEFVAYYVNSTGGESQLSQTVIVHVKSYTTTTITWMLALAAITLLPAAVVIGTMRRRRASSQPIPPFRPTPPVQTPPLPEDVEYMSQFFCQACGHSFWISGRRTEIPFCTECGTPGPMYLTTVKQ